MYTYGEGWSLIEHESNTCALEFYALWGALTGKHPYAMRLTFTGHAE